VLLEKCFGVKWIYIKAIKSLQKSRLLALPGDKFLVVFPSRRPAVRNTRSLAADAEHLIA